MFAFADGRLGIVRRHKDVYSRVFQSPLYDDMPDDERFLPNLKTVSNPAIAGFFFNYCF